MKLTEERKAEVLALCKKLISNRSYSGEEDAVAGALKYFMRQKKFDDFFTDQYGNVVGGIKGDRPGNFLMGIWTRFRLIIRRPGSMILSCRWWKMADYMDVEPRI